MEENVVRFISHKRLDIEKLKDNENLFEYLGLEYDSIEDEKEEIETYNSCDYKEIILQIKYSGNEYTLLHGFASGDEPVGGILLHLF